MSVDVTETKTGSLSERTAAQIRAVMAYHQVKQSHLARVIGVTEQWLSVRLRGVQAIDLNDLEKISEGLQVPVFDLLPKGVRPNERSARSAVQPSSGPVSAVRAPIGRPRAASTRPVSAVPANRRRPRPTAGLIMR